MLPVVLALTGFGLALWAAFQRYFYKQKTHGWEVANALLLVVIAWQSFDHLWRSDLRAITGPIDQRYGEALRLKAVAGERVFNPDKSEGAAKYVQKEKPEFLLLMDRASNWGARSYKSEHLCKVFDSFPPSSTVGFYDFPSNETGQEFRKAWVKANGRLINVKSGNWVSRRKGKGDEKDQEKYTDSDIVFMQSSYRRCVSEVEVVREVRPKGQRYDKIKDTQLHNAFHSINRALSKMKIENCRFAGDAPGYVAELLSIPRQMAETLHIKSGAPPEQLALVRAKEQQLEECHTHSATIKWHVEKAGVLRHCLYRELTRLRWLGWKFGLDFGRFSLRGGDELRFSPSEHVKLKKDYCERL